MVAHYTVADFLADRDAKSVSIRFVIQDVHYQILVGMRLAVTVYGSELVCVFK